MERKSKSTFSDIVRELSWETHFALNHGELEWSWESQISWSSAIGWSTLIPGVQISQDLSSPCYSRSKTLWIEMFEAIQRDSETELENRNTLRRSSNGPSKHSIISIFDFHFSKKVITEIHFASFSVSESAVWDGYLSWDLGTSQSHSRIAEASSWTFPFSQTSLVLG